MAYKRLPVPKWDAKNEKWVLTVQKDGVRKQFVSRKKSTGKKDVTERAAAWFDRQDAGQKTSRKLADVWALFLDDYLRRNGENEQIIQLRSLGRVFILPELGGRPIGKLSIEDFQAVINNAKPQKGRRPLSRKYLNNLKGAMITFNRWAIARDYMEKSLAGQLYVPADAQTKGRQILQIEDIERLFSRRVGLWYERALLLEVLTGLRPGEVLGLRVDDYKDGCLYIRRALNARGRITEGKNKNAIRCLKLPPEAEALVLEQLETIRQLVAYTREKWLFCNSIGGTPSQVQLRRCWARLVAAHDLPEGTTPYSLRHTFFTHTEAHLPDRLIKSVFGHSSATDSHKLYGEHALDGEALEASRRLAVTPLYEATKHAQN